MANQKTWRDKLAAIDEQSDSTDNDPQPIPCRDCGHSSITSPCPNCGRYKW